MWTCPKCENVNLDAAVACPKCGAARSADELVAAAFGAEREQHATAAVAQRIAASREREVAASAPPGSEEKPGRKPADWIALGVLGVGILGLLAVGVVAWQRGYFNGLLHRNQQWVRVVNQPATAPAAEDPLDKLNDDVAGLKAYRRYAADLHAIDSQIAAVTVQTSDPDHIADSTKQQLYELQKTGAKLTEVYGTFEEQAKNETSAPMQPYVELLRGEFVKRMVAFLTKTGEAYAVEQGANNPVFMMSDTFVAALQKYGRANPQPVKDAWLAAVHAQEQHKLSESLAPQIAELQQRLDALKKLHRDTNALLRASPKYSIRGGELDDTARNLLSVYDTLADRVEALVADFEKFSAGLPPDNRSDKLADLGKQFADLAQQDHMYAFTQTYKIYEKDKDLSDPAYKKLKAHYQWAKTHWPSLDGDYRRVYTESEGVWMKRWANKDEGTSAPPASDNDLGSTGGLVGGGNGGSSGGDNGGGGQ